MRLLILSDLHVEFGPFVPPADLDFDAVVLAGDIHVKGQAAEWAMQTFPDKPVILVLGNHDYYGGNLEYTWSQAQAACAGSKVHLLHNSSVALDGVRFLGGTLWTDYMLHGNRPLAMGDAQRFLSDHRRILTTGNATARPEHMAAEHEKTRSFLARELDEPFDGPTVIVTHHLPSSRCISPRYLGLPASRLNPAFASSMDHLMGPPVGLWIHGHTHDSVDTHISGTRIICNPRGYLGSSDENPSFNPALVVEI